MFDTTATQKAKTRSRLRRRIAACAGAADPAAADDCVQPALIDEARPPLAQIVVFPAGFDDNDAPPFDPPDDTEDIFGSVAEEEEELEFVSSSSTADALERADNHAERLECDPEARTAAAAPSEIESDAGGVDPVDQDCAAEPVDDPVAPGGAATPTASAFADDPLADDEPPPFDPPDEVDDGFRIAHVEEPQRTDDELLLVPAVAPNEQRPKAGLTRHPHVEPPPDRSTPPISIHISWDRADVAETLAGLPSDRRLTRAQISAERGGLDAAIAHCAAHGSPDVLILDTTLRGDDMLAGMTRLAALLERDSKVVVIGAVNDIALLRELAARGVSQYIVPPFKPDDLVRTVCGLYKDADKARVIAVIGARGGVGASTLARNLAWSIAERQQVAAALVDLDLSFGTAAFDLRQDAPHSIAEIIAAGDVDDALARVASRRSDRLSVYAAPATPACGIEPDTQTVDGVIAAVRRASQFVILDLPHLWNDGVRDALARADNVVIVSSPDLASLRNTDNMLRHLKATRAADFRPVVVLSMVGVPKRPEITFKDFCESVSTPPVASFAYDPALFGLCIENGQTVGEAAPRSKIAASIDALATRLTGREPIEQAKPPLTLDLPSVTRAGADRDAVGEALAAPALSDAVQTAQVAPPPDAQAAETQEPAAADPRARAPDEGTLAPPVPAPLELHEPAPARKAGALSGARRPRALPQRSKRSAGPRTHTPRATASRRRSTGLIRTAAAFIAAIVLAAWYVEQRRETAQAAEPQVEAAPASIRIEPVDPARELAAHYQRALARIEAGAVEEGVAALRRLAESGFAMAQYRLAKLHERGEIVVADLAAAREWTERAAVAGNVRAMHDLGVYFSRGESVARDDAAAFRWFRQAAEYDFVDSQYNLGILYQQGRGVRADPAEALFWYMVAARHGDAAATERSVGLETELTPMQVEQARARTRAFRPRAANPIANGLFDAQPGAEALAAPSPELTVPPSADAGGGAASADAP